MDYLNLDYTEIFRKRQERLAELRENPKMLVALKMYYKENPWDFINDWGMTFDPRKIQEGKLGDLPFVLWPKQREFLVWLKERYDNGEYGIVEKSRDCGVTWLCIAFACTMWLFSPGFSAGLGSAKEASVDTKGDPDCLFEKVRYFLKYVPLEFKPTRFNPRTHDGFMKMLNPDMGSSITGGAGDNIGRGGRKSMWLIDEKAFVEHQLLVDNALSQATNCQIDVSTYNGSGNQFYKQSMRFHNTPQKFIFDWRDDPRKDDAWYAKQKRELDPVTVAQEIDRDPNAAAEDIFIPASWVQAAIDLHKIIGLEPTGIRVVGFDPADTGDAKAVVNRIGYVITDADTMDTLDITQAIPWAYSKAFDHRTDILGFDADGMGAPAMKLAFDSHAASRFNILPFYGGGSVENPNAYYGDNKQGADRKFLKKNKDKFLNRRAQAATELRDRFEETYKIRQQIEAGNVALGLDESRIISIDSNCAKFQELVAELSRPKRLFNNSGKIQVESKKDMKARQIQSPNLFDAAMMAFSFNTLRQEKPKPTVSRPRVRDRGLGY